jgi:glucosamine--fructose-6-phosphate aminotransferase (isomerizing)
MTVGLVHMASPEITTASADAMRTCRLQMFAREEATARGNEVDQPRNLAKSVTVE